MARIAVETRATRKPRSSVARVASLARAEFILLRRNKVALFTAFVFPLLPFLLMIPMRINGKLDTKISTMMMATAVAAILICVVFINLLPTFVARREELVLKRLRTGECSDLEIMTGIALPAFAISIVLLLTMTLTTVIALGQPMPVNALLLLVAVLGGCLVFAGLALATSVITRNSEAAQVTSLPILLISLIGAGLTGDFLPDWADNLMQYTPLAPSVELSNIGWSGLTHAGTTVDFGASFSHAARPSLILLGWVVAGLWVARKRFRWEPRT